MIDRHLAESSPKVREALRTLTESNVLLHQRDRMFASLAEGADNEDPDKLATRILEYRWRAHALLELHQLGESLMEQNDE